MDTRQLLAMTLQRVPQVSLIVGEWLLMEYAVTFLPMNQSALVLGIALQ